MTVPLIPDVDFPDPELWLCGHIRTRLADSAVLVTNEWPEPLPPGRLVIVRYDGGTQTSYVTEESQYGFTVVGKLTDSEQEVVNLARLVRRFVVNCWGVAGPFANCSTSSGPARVVLEQRRARYFTASLTAVASPA